VYLFSFLLVFLSLLFLTHLFFIGGYGPVSARILVNEEADTPAVFKVSTVYGTTVRLVYITRS